jgi:hypothetical protein
VVGSCSQNEVTGVLYDVELILMFIYCRCRSVIVKLIPVCGVAVLNGLFFILLNVHHIEKC